MLTEERHAFILEQVKRSGSVTMTELCEQLGASESTVRRDLTQLDEKGLLKKVHGGAIAADDRSFSMVENDVESKSKLFTKEKTAIARYAASLIDDGDLVFIDAGTTTEKMIDFLPDKCVRTRKKACPERIQGIYPCRRDKGHDRGYRRSGMCQQSAKLQLYKMLHWCEWDITFIGRYDPRPERSKRKDSGSSEQPDSLHSCRPLQIRSGFGNNVHTAWQSEHNHGQASG